MEARKGPSKSEKERADNLENMVKKLKDNATKSPPEHPRVSQSTAPKAVPPNMGESSLRGTVPATTAQAHEKRSKVVATNVEVARLETGEANKDNVVESPVHRPGLTAPKAVAPISIEASRNSAVPTGMALTSDKATKVAPSSLPPHDLC